MKYGEESKGRSEEPKSDQDPSQPNLDRRSFLRVGALAAGGAALAPLAANAQSDDASAQDFGALSGDHDDIAHSSIARLQSSHVVASTERAGAARDYLRRVS
jgi:hypothetical protein